MNKIGHLPQKLWRTNSCILLLGTVQFEPCSKLCDHYVQCTVLCLCSGTEKFPAKPVSVCCMPLYMYSCGWGLCVCVCECVCVCVSECMLLETVVLLAWSYKCIYECHRLSDWQLVVGETMIRLWCDCCLTAIRFDFDSRPFHILLKVIKVRVMYPVSHSHMIYSFIFI